MIKDIQGTELKVGDKVVFKEFKCLKADGIHKGYKVFSIKEDEDGLYIGNKARCEADICKAGVKLENFDILNKEVEAIKQRNIKNSDIAIDEYIEKYGPLKDIEVTILDRLSDDKKIEFLEIKTRFNECDTNATQARASSELLEFTNDNTD